VRRSGYLFGRGESLAAEGRVRKKTWLGVDLMVKVKNAANKSSGSDSGRSNSSACVRKSLQQLEQITADDALWDTDASGAVRKLWAAQNQLRAEQAGAVDIRPQRSVDDVAKFKTWLSEKHGADLEAMGVELALLSTSIESSSGRPLEAGTPQIEVRALRAFGGDQLVMNIPESSFLSLDVVKNDRELASLYQNPMLSSMPSMMLSLVLLRERLRGDSSPFAPYIAMFPKEFSIPMFFEPDELDALEPSHVQELAVRRARNHARQYCQLRALLASRAVQSIPARAFTFEAFSWAVGVVMTRQNMVPSRVHDNAVLPALVPAWDMMNHCSGPGSTSFDEDSRSVIFHSIRSLRVGDPITMFYGPRSNASLLMYSGFVHAGNAHDFVPLSLQISDADPLKRVKNMVLRKLPPFCSDGWSRESSPTSSPNGSRVGGGASSTRSSKSVKRHSGSVADDEYVARLVSTNLCERLLLFARVACMDKDAVGSALREPARCAASKVPNAIELAYILEICSSFKSRYPSEEELNKRAELSHHHALIADLIRSELAIIDATVVAANEAAASRSSQESSPRSSQKST